MNTNLKCKHCGNENQSRFRLATAGPHVKASCRTCGTFTKFVTQTKQVKAKLPKLIRLF